MSHFSTLDGESFQKLLANAYAVQESQMDSQSLTAIVELQRLISRGDLDVDGALHLIVDGAQNVANATGVAIGLLKGDQLVYRAGSGSATTYIGRSVTARLVVSADSKTNWEILRVENAETDARIEAAICRQFGAKALLILLICSDHAVAGVLEIFFSEAHAFQDRELRAYRLMAGLVGEAMSHAAQLEQKKTVAAQLPTSPHAIEEIAAQGENLLNHGGSIRQSDVLATMITRLAKSVSWYNRRWNIPLGAVVTVLVLTCWTAYSHRRQASPLGSSALQRSAAAERQAPLLPATAVPTKATSELQSAPVRQEGASAAKTAVRRVRVGENEVDYIIEDVTVRYFTYKPASRGVPVSKNEVANIGEDVTVRHFMRKAAAVSPTPPIGGAVQPLGRSWSAPANSVPLKTAK
jgi:hypothetical protein